MKNRRCPRCQTHYAAPARFCVQDGTPLVEVAPPDDPPPPGAAADGRHPARVSDPDAIPADVAEAQRFATLSGQVLDGRYRIARRIGEGGMSWVYQADEVESGRTVAIKILTPRLSRDRDSVERLKREAEIATRFDHPNVCPILRFGQTPDGLIYLVMPYLSGETLSDFEGRRDPVPVDEGIPILVQACHGLQHAHDLGVIHRDLKPENIMLVPDASAGDGAVRAVVMDFGLAKERRAGAEVAKLTQTGIVLGTPEFMSPEQIRGKPLDGRSDIYAMGILAFELFTGKLPFTGKNAQETMVARLRGQPVSVRSMRPDLPAKLEAVIERALAIAPIDRFTTMEEMAKAFEAVVATGVFARFFRR